MDHSAKSRDRCNSSAGDSKGPARPLGGVWGVPTFLPSSRRRRRPIPLKYVEPPALFRRGGGGVERGGDLYGRPRSPTSERGFFLF
jgi:hypothetical protein